MIDVVTTGVTLIVPLVLLVIPGVALAGWHRDVSVLERAARIGLWSIVCLSLGTLVAAMLHVPVEAVLVISGCLVALQCWRFRRLFMNRSVMITPLRVVAAGVLLYGLLAVPFFVWHRGLPTGDSQKAFFWASEVVRTNQLPHYELAPLLLNRDPVDFYTPALHTLTALLLTISPAPLLAVGLWSIALGVAVALLAAALARMVYPQLPAHVLIGLTILFLLTHFRFLRYLREPGYHYQNIVGEVLLFGALLLGLSLVKRWRWPDAVLLGLTLVTLFFSHQFSAFLGAFALLPVALAVIGRLVYRHRLTLQHLLPLGIVLLIVTGGGVMLGLHEKIPHLFTAQPHLLTETPTWFDYPILLGSPWLWFGVGGLVVSAWWAYQTRSATLAAFTGSTLVLLLLSQGPRLFIDIPPVRALLYAVMPLSITGAALVTVIWQRLTAAVHSPRGRRLVGALLVGVVTLVAVPGVLRAYQLSHQVRTNSTLTVGQVVLAETLSQQSSGGVLVDDYNRRSSSWLVLGQKPMYTRIAADLQRQMNEAHQSTLRYDLYVHQLDYEKIFSLGSLPLIHELMERHDIAWVTGIRGTSASAFQHNRSLRVLAEQDDITLFTPVSGIAGCTAGVPADLTPWLLRTSTLANDIGDDEDTFEHLPVSVRSARLSEPATDGVCTYRTTRAPLIPLRFNVRDYVRVLWSPTQSAASETALELLITEVGSPAPLTVRTSTGERFPLPASGVLQLPATVVPYEADGFITLLLENPQGRDVRIDLVALGLARTL